MKKTILLPLFFLGLLLTPFSVFPMGGFLESLAQAFDDNIYAYHTPIYPRTAGQTVTFMAKANHPSGIKKIRFWVKLYPLSVDSSGSIVYGSPLGSWDSDTTSPSYSCIFTPPYPTSATCSFPFNTPGRQVPTNAYVLYSVSMRDGDDNLHRDRKIRADMKIVNEDIKDARDRALRIYRRGIKSEKFNVVFVSDNSSTTQNAYITMLETQVPSGLLKTSPPVHLDRYRRFFNLYMNLYSEKIDDTYTNPDGSGCSDSNLSDLEDEIPNGDDLTWADDFIIAHQPTIQDCSRAGLSTADDSNVVVHELMHSLFRLRDEYPDGGTSDAAGPHKNRYTSSSECVSHGSSTHATDYAASPGCRSLGTRADGTANPSQHWCPSSDIMVSNSSSMSTEEHSQILDYIGDGGLSAFSVVPNPRFRRVPDQTEHALIVKEIDDAIQADQAEERQEKTKKTLILKLEFDKNVVKLAGKRVVTGPAPHIFFPEIERNYLVSVMDRSGTLLQKFWIHDPRDIDNEKPLASQDIPGPAPEVGKLKLRIAFDAKMGKIVIQNRARRVLLQVSL